MYRESLPFESNDINSDDNENANSNNDENSNTDFENYDDIKIERTNSNKDGVLTVKKVTKKRMKAKFKASSPFAPNKKELNGSDNKVPSPSGYNFGGPMSEQILSIEFVCVIGNDIDLAEQDGIERRTRTTTLTTEQNEFTQGSHVLVCNPLFPKAPYLAPNFLLLKNYTKLVCYVFINVNTIIIFS